LGAIAEQCWDRGHCALSIDAIADEALVSRRTVYNALRSARGLGLIRDAGGLIRMIGPKWQALKWIAPHSSWITDGGHAAMIAAERTRSDASRCARSTCVST
jgi:hypothetical protein